MVYLSLNQLLHITIFSYKNAKTAKNVLDKNDPANSTPAAICPCITIFATKKVKTAKDLFNRKLLLLAQLQLLPSRYDFYKWKSKNRSSYEIRKLTCSYYHRITIFTIGKTKTDNCNQPNIPTIGIAAATLRSDFYEQKSENRLDIRRKMLTYTCCPCTIIFMSGIAMHNLDMR